MAGDLQRAFAAFEKMPPEKRRQLDEALSFMTTAQMPTEQGARHRGMLAEQEIDPQALRVLGAYRAYRFKLAHQPMDERKRAMLRLQQVPDDEIARLDSPDRWEQEQLGTFEPLMAMVKSDRVEMPAEKVTAKPPPKATRTKGKPAPKTEGAAPTLPAATPAPAEPMPQPQPQLGQPQPVMYAAPPVDERLPLGAILGGMYG